MARRKIGIIIGVLTLVCFNAFGQKPVISSISSGNGQLGETITISGLDFSDDSTDLQVTFGAVSARILSATENLLEVEVPAGATFNNIVVTNLTNGLSGASSEIFYLSYGGGSFQLSDLGAQEDFPTGKNNAYDLCLCDFDGDSLSDVAVTHQESAAIDIFENLSDDGGTPLFEKISTNGIQIGAATLNIDCADLDNDGRPDIVMTRGGNNGDKVFALRNTSSPGAISFGTGLDLLAASSGVRRVKIQDLDNNGKPEIIVTNEAENLIDIFENISTPGTIAFTKLPDLVVEGASATAGLDAKDLNGDGFAEIIVCAEKSINFYIFRNLSGPGNINMERSIEIPASGSFQNLIIADLDGDGWNDIAGTSVILNEVAILLNQTTQIAGDISYGTASFVSVANTPWGLDAGDLDGDGLVDLLVSHVSLDNEISYLRNTSSTGSPTFQTFQIPTTENNRNIKVGDVDDDGRPDLSFTSITNDQLSVMLNTNCVTPEITPSADVTICQGAAYRLEATQIKGATYLFEIDENRNNTWVTEQNSTLPYLDVTKDGRYRVTLISDGGACSELSNVVDVQVIISPLPPMPSASNSGPVCVGDPLSLSTPDVVGVTYEWTGPDNFSSTQREPTIASFAPENAGRYQIVISDGICTSDPGETVAEVRNLPFVAIINNGSNFFCVDSNRELTVAEFPGVSYQWYRDNAAISGATTSAYTVTQGGVYTCEISDGSCQFVTDTLEMVQTTSPVPVFSSLDRICVGSNIDFSATATGQSGLNIEYNWSFGDTNTAQGASVSHTYASTGSFTVTLTVNYEGVEGCSTVTQKVVEVINPPSLDIGTPDGLVKCPVDSVLLTIPDSIPTVLWSNGLTTNQIYLSNPDTISATVVDSARCMITTPSVEITNTPGAGITIVTDPDLTEMGVVTLDEGDSTILESDAAQDITWTPETGLSNPNIASPKAGPIQTVTYTIAAIDAVGCPETAQVQVVVVKNTNLDPPKFFSPNGDGQNQFFEIRNLNNVLELPDVNQCKLVVFDRRGSMVFEDEDYQNTWDGTYEGNVLEDGVYFYVIMCDNEQFNKDGSVLIVR